MKQICLVKTMTNEDLYDLKVVGTNGHIGLRKISIPEGWNSHIHL